LFKRDSRAESFRPCLMGKVPVISFMTLAELYRWSLERKWGEQRQAKLEQHLRHLLINRALCLKWAEVSALRRSLGRPLHCADAWIAATALLHKIPLLTNNIKDFKNIPDLEIISQ
jgi:tRNA(fMet)-specific endonuclease VapC